MARIKKTKQQKRNPFYDDKEFEKDVVGFARPRKGRSSKKDKAKDKSTREWEY